MKSILFLVKSFDIICTCQDVSHIQVMIQFMILYVQFKVCVNLVDGVITFAQLLGHDSFR